MINALVLHQRDGEIKANVQEVQDDALPDGDVLVSVQYSSLNYKDGLAVTGRGKIIRGEYPFVPGIDLVGQVEESESEAFEVGDLVVQTGGGLGETRWGGYSQLQRVTGAALVPLPESMTALRAMVLGTAGFTAMLSVMLLEQHGITPDRGEVVVTGASGGVGSLAVAILANLGYPVVASSGSEDAYDYLRELGATEIIHRNELGQGAARPLESARWVGAVDTVGGDTLAGLLSKMGWHGCVAACGNAGGHALNTTVFPFILRGVCLAGVDSNTATYEHRCEAWRRLTFDLPRHTLDEVLAGVIRLDQVPAMAKELLDGGVRGRIVVDVNA